MKTTKWYLLLIVAVALLLGSGLTTIPRSQANASGLTTAAPADCPPSWSIVPSPNVADVQNILHGVAAISSSDVWAVGDTYTNSVGATLIEHWDGSNWSVVPSPNGNGLLYGVTAISSNDVWAVGGTYNGSAYVTLIEHWDGSSWSVVSSPTPNGNGELNGVTAISSNNVWAVGYTYNGSASATLIEQWDGSSWSVIPSPSPDTGRNILRGVAAISASDVWAAGNTGYLTPPTARTLVEHWNGSSWSVVSSPYSDTFAILYGVAAASSNDVWAVGYSSSDTFHALTEHWDGSNWSVVVNPSGSVLNGVAAISSSDVWAVGAGNGTLTEHWDGSRWSIVPSPNPGTNSSSLNGVAAISSSDVWAAGQSSNETLVEHYSTACSTGTPTSGLTNTPAATNTPAITNTPAGPTNTPPGLTNTPAPTNTPQPTICANPFVDINNDIFFYAINYLYCHSAVNGTDATHYSPAGTSTRGQFAKVVVLGFGLPSYTPTTPDFSDVRPVYFAYGYIESGYHAGILSGYDANTCAAHGVAYPCYLPNLPITRGQLTKLVVNAAHYPLYTPSSGQDFTDVPPANVFYPSIETAYHKGVVGGYPDHTYRPNNPIRRDEMAQIVYKGVTTP